MDSNGSLRGAIARRFTVRCRAGCWTRFPTPIPSSSGTARATRCTSTRRCSHTWKADARLPHVQRRHNRRRHGHGRDQLDLELGALTRTFDRDDSPVRVRLTPDVAALGAAMKGAANRRVAQLGALVSANPLYLYDLGDNSRTFGSPPITFAQSTTCGRERRPPRAGIEPPPRSIVAACLTGPCLRGLSAMC